MLFVLVTGREREDDSGTDLVARCVNVFVTGWDFVAIKVAVDETFRVNEVVMVTISDLVLAAVDDRVIESEMDAVLV